MGVRRRRIEEEGRVPVVLAGRVVDDGGAALPQSFARLEEVLAAQDDVMDALASGGTEPCQRMAVPEVMGGLAELEVGVADLDARSAQVGSVLRAALADGHADDLLADVGGRVDAIDEDAHVVDAVEIRRHRRLPAVERVAPAAFRVVPHQSVGLASFGELQEYAEGVSGIGKEELAAPDAGPLAASQIVEQGHALVLQCPPGGLEVRHLHADVVDPLAPPFQVTDDTAVSRCRFPSVPTWRSPDGSRGGM